jgi:hypothetical protein
LGSSEPFRQANVGTIKQSQQGIQEGKNHNGMGIKGSVRGKAYIFIPAKASLKSCSELLYARLPTQTRLVFPAEAST